MRRDAVQDALRLFDQLVELFLRSKPAARSGDSRERVAESLRRTPRLAFGGVGGDSAKPAGGSCGQNQLPHFAAAFAAEFVAEVPVALSELFPVVLLLAASAAVAELAWPLAEALRTLRAGSDVFGVRRV